MPRGIRGVRRSQELLENIAALAAGMGITAFMAMYDVQTEPLEAIAKIAVIHESLGWINNEVSQALEIIHDEALRAARVVENLRAFARRRETRKEYSDINDILERTLELRAYEIRTSNSELVVEFASGLPEVMVDFHQIQEVFLNIILNAEQVMSEANHGGKLSIKTEQVKNYVRVSFADDGPGIPAEHRARLFDPFFTTREEKGGTGLGLSVCYGIITEHGGRIHARSKPGKGATFFVELPCA